jgi:hypothetical protein
VAKEPAPAKNKPAPADADKAPLDSRTMPLGVQSVLAAANGGDPRYIPVPIVTVPQPNNRPPQPPPPNLPKAPQPNVKDDMSVNAFTPPDNGQTPAAGAQGVRITYGAPGYGYPAQGMYPPPGYPQMVQAACPPYGSMAPVPAGRGVLPVVYQGPQPPNPIAGPMPPAAPYGAGAWGPPAVAANPAMDRRFTPAVYAPNQAFAGQQAQEWLKALHDSPYPSQREVAAYNLTTLDWRSQPLVVQGLLTAAKEDPAPTVRAGCVTCLARMNVQTPAVVSVLNSLKTDGDPRVRQEAEQALVRLAPGQAAASDQPAVQPVSATNP